MTTFFSFLLAATSHQVFQGNAAMSTIEWRPTCFFIFRSPAESPISQRCTATKFFKATRR
jgi:hypothetical protein